MIHMNEYLTIESEWWTVNVPEYILFGLMIPKKKAIIID